ncbi:MAG: hypothetical protein IT316_00930, partial [Anaerolineales bacterium]|nr:hypothetical protein [Anaerolineales bacterium]
ELESLADDQLLFAAGPADSYPHGALYLNGTPQESQLRFSLIYDPFLLARGIFQEVLYWALWSLLASFLFIIPGWVILRFAMRDWGNFLWAEKLALAGGLSAALYPVVFLWSRLAGLQPGPLIAWAAALLGFAALSWEARQFVVQGRLKALLSTKSLKPSLYESVLLAAILITAATRFWAVRTLDAPLWGDGYQHTMITQLLVDHKGLFNSWLPYAEIGSFTYHFGFHAASALFHWITGLSVPKSVLYTGQVFNLLAVFALYPLTMRLTRNRWTALLSLIAAGLLFPLPMAYVNWSRYTQLAGQVILPAFVCLVWLLFENLERDKGLIALAGLTLGGLALTHYRVVVLALAFIPAWLLLNLRQQRLTAQIKKVFWIGAISFAVTLPWLVRLRYGRLKDVAGGSLSAPPGASSDLSLVLGNTTGYLPLVVWLAMPLIILWGLARRERRWAIVPVWWFFIFMMTNPHLVGLPGSGLITNFTIFIAAYIPAALLLGCGVGWLSESLQNSSKNERPRAQWLSHPAVKIGGTALLLAVCLLGARGRLSDMKVREHILLTRPDLRASAWIKTNLPEPARLVVNSFFAYQGTVIAGSDGGWWLPLTAGRLTSQPPLNYASEQGLEPGHYQMTNALVVEIEEQGLANPQVLRDLLSKGYTHIYVGQLQGRVNSNAPLLDPDALIRNPLLQPVYHRDRVWIFAIDSP